MATNVKDTEVKEPKVRQRKRNPNYVRIAVEVPKANLEDMKVLCNIYGKTQKEMIVRAFDKYVADRRELVKQFLDLRAKSEIGFVNEGNELKAELEKEINGEEN